MKPNRSITGLLLWPLLWLKNLLTRDIRLRWQGRRPRLVVEQPVRSSRVQATTTPSTRPGHDADIALSMQIELRHLINQHMKTREFMRHLGYIEHALRRGGPEALNDIPMDVLARGHEQLKSLVREWSTPGLSELRSRLAVTIAAKEEEAALLRPVNSGLSDFFTTTRLQVTEATPSDFQAVEQNWAK